MKGVTPDKNAPNSYLRNPRVPLRRRWPRDGSLSICSGSAFGCLRLRVEWMRRLERLCVSVSLTTCASAASLAEAASLALMFVAAFVAASDSDGCLHVVPY